MSTSTRLIGGTLGWASTDGTLHRRVPVALRGIAGVTGTARGPIMLFDNTGEAYRAEPSRLWVVADLDLTNEGELRTLTGCTGDSCQLVATLYAEEGPRFVRRLRGAFAVALWNETSQELLLAVDHFGIKRLFHASDRRSFAFANRASALATLSDGGAQVDSTAIYNYLNFGFVPAPTSVFHGVTRLHPGHMLIAHAGRSRVEPYWDMRYPERRVRRRDAAEMVYRLTNEAVGRVLEDVSPKEVGGFLSGGTDSSTIIGLMARSSDQPVNAFSIGFAENAYDELDYARLAARHFDATHHTTTVTPEAAFEVLPRLIEAFDEPFGNNSAIGTFFCADLARSLGVGLLIAGDGGDEIFGGNTRYRADRIFGLYSDLPRWLRRGLMEPVILNLPNGGESVLGRAQRYIRRASLPNPRRFYSYEFFFALEAARFFTPDFLAAIDVDAPYRVTQTSFDRVQATSELNRLLYLDLKLAIGDNDLLKVTRTAELAGVQVRFPMLDLDLVEYTGTLPARLKVRGLEMRHLFKRAFRQLLPRETLAKRKHGFGVPTSAWLREHRDFRQLARETLLSSRARARGYFRADAIEELLDWHQSDVTSYYGDLLWRILMLELWHLRHLDGAPA